MIPFTELSHEEMYEAIGFYNSPDSLIHQIVAILVVSFAIYVLVDAIYKNYFSEGGYK